MIGLNAVRPAHTTYVTNTKKDILKVIKQERKVKKNVSKNNGITRCWMCANPFHTPIRGMEMATPCSNMAHRKSRHIWSNGQHSKRCRRPNRGLHHHCSYWLLMVDPNTRGSTMDWLKSIFHTNRLTKTKPLNNKIVY